MAGFRSRIRHFRAPVVVTVTLGAMPGCSGKTLDDDGVEKLRTSCPTTAPSEGAGCDYAGPPCEYDVCMTHPTKAATCSKGAWRVAITSCNPPPPNTSCPDDVPQQQSYCDYQGPPCDYGDCYGSPTHRATCDGNQWKIAESSCNPPPPPVTVCPVEKPISGAYCNYAGPACEYDHCGLATTRATCDAATWTVSHSTCNPPPPENSDAGQTRDGAADGN